MLERATTIKEVQLEPGIAPPAELLLSDVPWIARGYVSDWPLVEASENSAQSALSYLAGFYQGRPVNAFLAEPESNGRFFYNDEVTGFNFVQVSTQLTQVFDKLLAFSQSDQKAPHSTWEARKQALGCQALMKCMPCLLNSPTP